MSSTRHTLERDYEHYLKSHQLLIVFYNTGHHRRHPQLPLDESQGRRCSSLQEHRFNKYTVPQGVLRGRMGERTSTIPVYCSGWRAICCARHISEWSEFIDLRSAEGGYGLTFEVDGCSKDKPDEGESKDKS